MSYIKEGLGIPIEIRLNPQLSYSKIFLKVEEEIDGYEPFKKDAFGNVMQEKTFRYEFSLVKDELNRLCTIEDR